MAELPRYEIQYTDSAIQDISEKAEYIADHFLDPPLALRWYERLRDEIVSDLTTLPNKYPVYSNRRIEDACQNRVDLAQNVSGGDTPFNRRYILDYSVTNGSVFELPHTGSSDFRWIWIAFAFAGMLASGSVVILAAFKRRELNA